MKDNTKLIKVLIKIVNMVLTILAALYMFGVVYSIIYMALNGMAEHYNPGKEMLSDGQILLIMFLITIIFCGVIIGVNFLMYMKLKKKIVERNTQTINSINQQKPIFSAKKIIIYISIIMVVPVFLIFLHKYRASLLLAVILALIFGSLLISDFVINLAYINAKKTLEKE